VADRQTDGDLVRQALAGKVAAYGELVHRWAARITAFCHAKVRSPDAAEDLAQETLLRGYRALGTLADPDCFGTWLHGIALRACLDWLKSKARTQVTFSTLGPAGSADHLPDSATDWQESRVEREDELRLLMREVDDLPEEYREVLMLYYYDDVTYQDLALMLGVSAATVNARLTKARAMLRERLASWRR
jgi:RNA polymerase sigma-70 factor (ECF subfamily)